MPESPWKTAGELGTVGLSFVIAIALGTALGWWIDRTFGTNPWGFFVCFAFGVAAGVLNVYRIMGRLLRGETRHPPPDPRG
jgi:ATP synthase protein I